MGDHTRLLGDDPARDRYEKLCAALDGEPFAALGQATLARLAAWTTAGDIEILTGYIEQAKGSAQNKDHATLIEVSELVNASKDVDESGHVLIALSPSLVRRVTLRDS